MTTVSYGELHLWTALLDLDTICNQVVETHRRRNVQLPPSSNSYDDDATTTSLIRASPIRKHFLNKILYNNEHAKMKVQEVDLDKMLEDELDNFLKDNVDEKDDDDEPLGPPLEDPMMEPKTTEIVEKKNDDDDDDDENWEDCTSSSSDDDSDDELTQMYKELTKTEGAKTKSSKPNIKTSASITTIAPSGNLVFLLVLKNEQDFRTHFPNLFLPHRKENADIKWFLEHKNVNEDTLHHMLDQVVEKVLQRHAEILEEDKQSHGAWQELFTMAYLWEPEINEDTNFLETLLFKSERLASFDLHREKLKKHTAHLVATAEQQQQHSTTPSSPPPPLRTPLYKFTHNKIQPEIESALKIIEEDTKRFFNNSADLTNYFDNVPFDERLCCYIDHLNLYPSPCGLFGHQLDYINCSLRDKDEYNKSLKKSKLNFPVPKVDRVKFGECLYYLKFGATSPSRDVWMRLCLFLQEVNTHLFPRHWLWDKIVVEQDFATMSLDAAKDYISFLIPECTTHHFFGDLNFSTMGYFHMMAEDQTKDISGKRIYSAAQDIVAGAASDKVSPTRLRKTVEQLDKLSQELIVRRKITDDDELAFLLLSALKQVNDIITTEYEGTRHFTSAQVRLQVQGNEHYFGTLFRVVNCIHSYESVSCFLAIIQNATFPGNASRFWTNEQRIVFRKIRRQFIQTEQCVDALQYLGVKFTSANTLPFHIETASPDEEEKLLCQLFVFYGLVYNGYGLNRDPFDDASTDNNNNNNHTHHTRLFGINSPVAGEDAHDDNDTNTTITPIFTLFLREDPVRYAPFIEMMCKSWQLSLRVAERLNKIEANRIKDYQTKGVCANRRYSQRYNLFYGSMSLVTVSLMNEFSMMADNRPGCSFDSQTASNSNHNTAAAIGRNKSSTSVGDLQQQSKTETEEEARKRYRAVLLFVSDGCVDWWLDALVACVNEKSFVVEPALVNFIPSYFLHFTANIFESFMKGLPQQTTDGGGHSLEAVVHLEASSSRTDIRKYFSNQEIEKFERVFFTPKFLTHFLALPLACMSQAQIDSDARFSKDFFYYRNFGDPLRVIQVPHEFDTVSYFTQCYHLVQYQKLQVFGSDHGTRSIASATPHYCPNAKFLSENFFLVERTMLRLLDSAKISNMYMTLLMTLNDIVLAANEVNRKVIQKRLKENAAFQKFLVVASGQTLHAPDVLFVFPLIKSFRKSLAVKREAVFEFIAGDVANPLVIPSKSYAVRGKE